jgi:hypothetical protein
MKAQRESISIAELILTSLLRWGWVFIAIHKLVYPRERLLLTFVGFSMRTWFFLVSIFYTHSLMTNTV